MYPLSVQLSSYLVQRMSTTMKLNGFALADESTCAHATESLVMMMLLLPGFSGLLACDLRFVIKISIDHMDTNELIIAKILYLNAVYVCIFI